MIRRNIIANISGGAWIALLTIAITPLQVHLLGMESYGVIGFIATLQVALGVFDLGLSATLTRELAGDQSEGRRSSIKLVQTVSSIYWALALIFGCVLLVLLSHYADQWFNAKELDVAAMTTGMGVAAVYLALRWPVAFYTGVLSGIQRMDILNIVKVGSVSVRLLGGIAVLLVWPDLESFLIWLAISALVEVMLYAWACRSYFPVMPRGFKVFKSEILRVWRYTLSMNAIAVLSLILTQTDRLIVSKMLDLELLGHYMLAYTTASVILIVQLGISSAMFPAFAEAYEQHGRQALIQRYQRASQLTLFVIGLLAFPLVFFGESILAVWVGAETAASTWLILSLLAVGFFISGGTANAFQAALACHAPSLPFRFNLILIAPYLLLLYLAISGFGLLGAGTAWVMLHLVYLGLFVPLVHRSILGIPYLEWLLKVVLRYLLLGLVIFGGWRLFANSFVVDGVVTMLVMLGLALVCYGGAGFAMLDTGIRTELIRKIKEYGYDVKKEKL
jgi:O-antigen/teichoic acid export membrane protein